MSQSARERAMRAFSSGQVHVMVATDIAARGIDISGVELVVHVDPPAEHKAYLHRSGRTARAGAPEPWSPRAARSRRTTSGC